MVTNNSNNEPTAASGKVLQGQGIGTASNYSTATYPSTATGTGKILRADGTNWVATTATYPDTAGTSTNVLTSDGTNWISAAAPGGGIVVLTGTLTSAQIKALHATPITVVSAPGSGKYVHVISCGRQYNYGGSNVFTAGASQRISLNYGTTSVEIDPLVSNATLTGTSSNQFYEAGDIASSTISNVDNQAVTLYNSVATEITGNAANDNTVDWVVIYTIVTL